MILLIRYNDKKQAHKGLVFILKSIIPSTNITHTIIPQPDNLFFELLSQGERELSMLVFLWGSLNTQGEGIFSLAPMGPGEEGSSNRLLHTASWKPDRLRARRFSPSYTG